MRETSSIQKSYITTNILLIKMPYHNYCSTNKDEPQYEATQTINPITEFYYEPAPFIYIGVEGYVGRFVNDNRRTRTLCKKPGYVPDLLEAKLTGMEYVWPSSSLNSQISSNQGLTTLEIELVRVILNNLKYNGSSIKPIILRESMNVEVDLSYDSEGINK